MVKDPDTDSLFTAEDAADLEKLAEVRFIHESKNGYCVVYAGVCRGRRIAFKVLKAQYQASELHRRMLRKEFEVASMMNHPNIIATLRMENLPDYGEAIIMEYVEGVTLKEYLEANPRLSSGKEQSITEQICQAVSYIHSRQTIHCDLKPSNILITSDGRFIKIIDFGMSRGNGFETLDFAGGTRGFTAPENFSAGSRATVATDIYSIGRIMEFMDRDGAMKRVWRRCIAANPAERPASADEIPELLRKNRIRKKKLRRITLAALLLIACCAVIIPEFINRPIITRQPQAAVSEVTDTAPTPPAPQETVKETQAEPQTDAETARTEAPEEVPSTEESQPAAEAESGTFEAELDKKFNQVAARRFKEHLMLIDTMTTVRSLELQQVSHWRWLAKQDMKRWLSETLGSNYPKIEQEMSDMNRRLDEFMKADDREHTEWVHRTEAAKHEPYRSGCSTKYAYHDGLDVVVRRLGEDGVWRETRTTIPLNRLDPVEDMKTRAEYMKKAMED